MPNHEQKALYHPDVLVFAIAIPLISAFNYYLTYTNIQFDWVLLLTFTIDTTQGYIAWLAVREIILKLDKRLPYNKSIFKRIVVQLAITLVAGLGIIIVTTEMVSWIFKGRPAVASFYEVDIWIISIWFWVINGFYIGMYFYGQWSILDKDNSNLRLRNRRDAGVYIRVGNKSIFVKLAEVLLVYVEDSYTLLEDKNGKIYILENSLDKLEKQLPTPLFFRINRQCILHRQSIAGFMREKNGKLKVETQSKFKDHIKMTISRTKAPAFKKWFLK